MCSLKILPVVLVLSTLALATTALQLTSADEVAAKIVAHEQAEVQLLRQYTPLVETYIQYLRADTQAGSVPHGDKYFLGRAELAQRTGLELLDRTIGMNQKLFRGLGEFFSMEFVPRGFLQMIYVDGDGFDRNHYRFEYARREFLGDVRCLVFYIDPLTKSGKGRFVSRIWVEDRDYHIVRINGAYGGSSLVSNYFNFDSWRINAGNNLWLPAFIYSEEGSVNEVLETVINNIEVTNGLNIQPEDRCRVLMTSTLESLTMGHTIVLSRALIDVQPEEARLAAILAHEIGHIVLGHRMDSKFGFFDNVRVNGKETFRHFDLGRTPEEERAASRKRTELFKNSPYSKSQGTAQLFFQALKDRSQQIPNLVSPNLGDRVETSWTKAPTEFSTESNEKTSISVIAALPLGGRNKIDPWNDQLRMLKSKPSVAIAESEKMLFQITHFLFYLTRQADNSASEDPGAVATKLPSGSKP